MVKKTHTYIMLKFFFPQFNEISHIDCTMAAFLVMTCNDRIYDDEMKMK